MQRIPNEHLPLGWNCHLLTRRNDQHQGDEHRQCCVLCRPLRELGAAPLATYHESTGAPQKGRHPSVPVAGWEEFTRFPACRGIGANEQVKGELLAKGREVRTEHMKHAKSRGSPETWEGAGSEKEGCQGQRPLGLS